MDTNLAALVVGYLAGEPTAYLSDYLEEKYDIKLKPQTLWVLMVNDNGYRINIFQNEEDALAAAKSIIGELYYSGLGEVKNYLEENDIYAALNYFNLHDGYRAIHIVETVIG